jgi:hypothetical protein
VLSQHNAIGTPALLPDGSIARESVIIGSMETQEERQALPTPSAGEGGFQ